MRKFQAAYIPIGVGTFHMESAEDLFERSVRMLSTLTDNLAVPAEKLLTVSDLKSYLDTIDPDLIILQNLTFANSAYAAEIMHKFSHVPLLLWTLREPVIDGTRLRLNSLTGAFSAGNTIRCFKEGPFAYMYGSPEEDKIIKTAADMIKAAKVYADMHDLNLAAIGHTPEGFGFGRALDHELLRVFGVHQISIEARELIEKAENYSDQEIEKYLQDAEKRTVGLSLTPEKNRKDFARLYKAYATWIRDNQIGALASRCWPDFFTSFGTPVCAVLAMLNDLGIASACETDTYGALSMWICMQLSSQPVFFGDPVSLDEKENTITFWHCGTAACSLAREDTGAAVGEHCNRHIGPTMEFGCKASEEAVIFRIGRNPDGKFRFLIAQGEALDKEKQFYGTSTVIRMKNDAENMIMNAVKEGWEPHYVIAYRDISGELTMLGDILNIEVVKY